MRKPGPASAATRHARSQNPNPPHRRQGHQPSRRRGDEGVFGAVIFVTSAFMILAATAVVAVIMSLTVLVIVTRRPASSQVASSTHPGALSTYPAACAGPIERLCFTESLDPERFSNAARAATLEAARVHWERALGDGAIVILNGVRAFIESGNDCDCLC